MKDPVRKKTGEEFMEGKYCHGDAIGTNLETTEENMLGDSHSLKAKIEKERFYERKPFKKKKENLENFYKSNIADMLEDRKYRIYVERKDELDAVARKAD
jgi:hypothetical protein